MEPFTLTREQVREIDRRAIDGFGIPGLVLMENAGRGCADLFMRLNPERKSVVILCGPGNNGGDGFVMARHLDNHGYHVSVYAYGCPSPKNNLIIRGWDYSGLPHDARANLEVLLNSNGEVFPLDPNLLQPSPQTVLLNQLTLSKCWIVDALFGTGLNRSLVDPYSELIAITNASGNPVLSVDLPTGLDCDTGEPLGPTIRASHTATFVAWKRGFLNPKSQEWTGDVHTIDIGVPRKLIDEYRPQ